MMRECCFVTLNRSKSFLSPTYSSHQQSTQLDYQYYMLSRRTLSSTTASYRKYINYKDYYKKLQKSVEIYPRFLPFIIKSLGR